VSADVWGVAQSKSSMAEAAPPWAMKRKASFEPDGAKPLMKMQAKSASLSNGGPLTKAPISKMPPPGKAPVAKMAPITKRPPPAQPGAAVLPNAGPSFAKRPPAIPSKAAPADFSKAPPSSPSPGSDQAPPASPPVRGSSWQEFNEVDPLYAMLGEIGEKTVRKGDEDELDEERTTEYIERIFGFGAVIKPKDWIEVWAAMDIPVTISCHAQVVQMIIELGVQSEVGENVGEILAELVKGHRAKVKAVEQAVTTIFECGCDEKDCIARFLLLIFPKSPTSEWGWSRIGWSWKEWWNISSKIFNCLEETGAFEALKSLLSSIETDSGTYLPHQQIWDETRLAVIRGALCRYGKLKEEELAEKVELQLS